MRLSSRSMMVYGAIMMAMSSLFMVWAQDFALFAFAQILFGLGQGFGRPGFSAGASLAATHEQQGDIAGLITAANSMRFVVSPFFGLWMYGNISREAPFIFCTGLLVLLSLYAYFASKGGGKPSLVIDAIAKSTD
jgi:MFS family permease